MSATEAEISPIDIPMRLKYFGDLRALSRFALRAGLRDLERLVRSRRAKSTDAMHHVKLAASHVRLASVVEVGL